MGLSINTYGGIAGMLVLDYLFYRAMVKPWWKQMAGLLKLMRNGIYTKGIIVDYVQKQDLDQRDQYAPVVKFIDAVGKTHIVESDDFRMFRPQINKQVDVCYEVHEPAGAVVNPASLVAFKLFLLILVVVILVVLNIAMGYKLIESEK